MLRFYSNENMEAVVLDALRAIGHDIALAADDGVGREDDHVLRTAVALQRIVLTHDKDYGTLIFRDAAKGVPAVVLIRLSSRSPSELADLVAQRIQEVQDQILGHFVVISDQGTRVVRLPI